MTYFLVDIDKWLFFNNFLIFFLGFSLGDELGFGESLSNTDSNRRRSLNVKTGTNGVYPGEKIMVSLVIKI